MQFLPAPCRLLASVLFILIATALAVRAEDNSAPTLDDLKRDGAANSALAKRANSDMAADAAITKPRLEQFRRHIKPLLQEACSDCHGADDPAGNVQIDTLNPDLFHGEDVIWWTEVLAVVTNGDMPPPDEVELADKDRAKIVQWLSTELHAASIAARRSHSHSSLRRMTKYEYNYALQDLLGLPFNFANDLPPDPNSEDGFQNSSEMLHLSGVQLATYRDLGLRALRRATVAGERPQPLYWSVQFGKHAEMIWAEQDKEAGKLRGSHKDDPEELVKALAKHQDEQQRAPNATYYKDRKSGRVGKVYWRYSRAKYAWSPQDSPIEEPSLADTAVVIPAHRYLIVELGDRIPNRGTLKVRVRASRREGDKRKHPVSLQLQYGWQASNDSSASVPVGGFDHVITAKEDAPEFYEWEVAISEIQPRNLVRGTNKLGDLPSPSEYIKLVNRSLSGGDIQIDCVEVTAPLYETWPPQSHTAMLGDADADLADEDVQRDIFARFMTRAWRRPATDAEVEQKVRLCQSILPQCETSQDAVLEVLATVLSSPKFLLIGNADSKTTDQSERLLESVDSIALASRLSFFLWASVPDEELMRLATDGKLRDKGILRQQVERLLSDPRSGRFVQHFTRQWLGMQLLDYLNVDRKVYRGFDPTLKEAIATEPIEFFRELLADDQSVLNFIHADFTVANERLSHHYGLPGVHGNHFRKVSFPADRERGGLLTAAGLLAMNSDGSDSHPLKRGVWMLERLLNDPPPPPPPAVPEIDLADPEIAKMTLKERIEDHRDQAACRSCHEKIDPWGIAMENFDAIGSWRNEIDGEPVDSTARLANRHELNGIDGLKRYLLAEKQDQFVLAITHKLLTYALGRPLTFADRAEVEKIAGELRRRGDGLRTLVELIVTSDVFLSR